MHSACLDDDHHWNNATSPHSATMLILGWDLYINVSKNQLPGLGKNKTYCWTPYYYPLSKSIDDLSHILVSTTCDTTTDEPDNLNYGAGLDQIIIEILSKSHQAPQMRLKISFQRRNKYGQPWKIPIRILFLSCKQPDIHPILPLWVFRNSLFLDRRPHYTSGVIRILLGCDRWKTCSGSQLIQQICHASAKTTKYQSWKNRTKCYCS